jgi:hypothetical protein
MRETQRERRGARKKKKKKEKRRWKLLISYKRADSLLLPAQHPPDVFDSRYCGAHTHTVKKEGKFTTKRKRHCVCTVYRPPPPAAGLGLPGLGPSQTPQPSALSFTCTPAFFF